MQAISQHGVDYGITAFIGLHGVHTKLAGFFGQGDQLYQLPNLELTAFSSLALEST
jgi:hypothetical protein